MVSRINSLNTKNHIQKMMGSLIAEKMDKWFLDAAGLQPRNGQHTGFEHPQRNSGQSNLKNRLQPTTKSL